MNLENSAVRSLPAPEYSEEELDKIFQYFMTLKSDLIREFLSGKDLQKSGTKSDLAELISKYLQDGDITYSDLVNYLDTVTPYMKQHIHIFDGPESRVLDSWRDPAKVSDLLKRNNLIELLNSRLPLILPQSLSISSIVYLPEKTLTVYSVERREYFERREEYDKKIIENGEEIELRAHCHNIGRGFVIFRWDLIENTALLQISQLESGSDYEQVVENFSQLVQPWLDLSIFQNLTLGESSRNSMN